MKKLGNSPHHGRHPGRILLGPHAIPDDLLKEWVSSDSTEGVISNFPVHVMLLAKMIIERYFFERKHTARRQQRFQARPKKHIKVEIKATQPVDNKVAKEIKALNILREPLEHRLIFGKLASHKAAD